MKLLSTLFFTTFIFSSSALAIDNYHIECKTCVTKEQFVQFAKENAIYRETIYVNVMNFENYEIKKYRVYKNRETVCDPNGREPDGEGGFIQDCWFENTLTANEVSLTNSELNLFTDLAEGVNDLEKQLSQRTVEITEDILPSAFDIVATPNNGKIVISHYDSLSYFDNSVASKFLIAFEAIIKTVSVGISFNAPAVKFTFSDDSEAYAVFDFLDSDGVAHMKFVKVISENGIEVDLTKDNPFKKSYDVSGMSLTSWQSLLTAFNAYGLVVRGASTKIVPRGTITVTDCSTSTETLCRNPL
ncbi:hypothetical protein [Shewanella sp. MBTL60-007]|uniref:hypothetical protein n=1 Tax=Shewanella sp. MBTL60-007 TaxID=2815911 RepID=UPI001BC74F9E|nr:hypothetical protein [Shewanella sp. MBTL60-007]GIU30557.1 hypothetical protein TUM3792_41460 [Shewanella sp. MBTL60-007]